MTKRLLLYTRRGDTIRGPFPSKQITRHVLLGRLKVIDEVSIDQINWKTISEFPEIIPEEMSVNADDPQAQERLKLARYREDERLSGDRRENNTTTGSHDNRSSGNRRQAEPYDVKKHRIIKTEIYKEGKKPESYLALHIAVAVFIGIAATAYFIKSSPVDVTFVKQCDSTPRPGADWRDCNMEGAVIEKANLKKSKLRNVNMIGSTIKSSDLSESDLAYGNFSLVNFRFTNFNNANLLGSVLRKANLSNTNMLNANLSFSILQDADLSYANLKNANLANADLSGAIITGIILQGANLENAVWIDQRVCLAGSKGKCVLSEEKKQAGTNQH